MLYVQNIFLPNEDKLNKSLNSINSLVKYLDENPYDIDVYVGGYAAKKEYWDQIAKAMKGFKNHTSLVKFDKNFGKAIVTNTLVKLAQEKKEYEYILLSDYDMKFIPEETNFFDRLIESSKKVTEHKKKPFGMIAINQAENNCHIMKECRQNVFKYTNSFNQVESVVWNNYPGHIGGGCIFTTTKVWNKIGGYRVMGVYAGDDAYYLLDVRDKGYTWQLLETLHVVHPKDPDKEYNDFKWNICKRITNGRNKTKQINIFINQMDVFWARRQNEKGS